MIPWLRLLVRVDNESATLEDETVVASAVGRPGRLRFERLAAKPAVYSRFAARLSPVQTERAAPGAALGEDSLDEQPQPAVRHESARGPQKPVPGHR